MATMRRGRGTPAYRPGPGGRAVIAPPKRRPSAPPAAAAPAPGAPPQAPSPVASAMPVDPGYDAAIGAAGYGLQSGLLNAQYQRGQLGPTFGLGIDPSGNVFEDVSNPYSRAASFQKQYGQAQRATNTSMSARGQLYSGAYQNAANANTDAFNRNKDANIRAFMAAHQSIAGAERAAQGEYLGAVAGAESERIGRALQNRPDPMTVAPPPLPAVPAQKKPPSEAMKKRVKARWRAQGRTK